MPRLLAIALGLMLLVPMATGGTGAATTIQAEAAPQIEFITLDAPSTDAMAQGSLDLSTVLAIEHAGAATRLDHYTLSQRLGYIQTEATREPLIIGYVAQVNQQVADLWARRQVARQRYRNGSIDAGRYLRELAIVHARVGHLRPASIEDGGLDSAAARIRRRLETRVIGLEGPVTGAARDAFRGNRLPVTVYVKSASEGTVLATMDDGTYVREAYRADARKLGENAPLGLSTLVDQVLPRFYPETRNRSTGSQVQQYSGRDLVKVRFDLNGGSVETYFDSDTRQPFFERHRFEQPGAFDRTAPTTAVASEGLRLSVTRTITGGPLRIATTSNDTGRPVRSTVFFDGRRVRTNDEGIAWILLPPGQEFLVRAAGPGGPVSLTIRPVAPTEIR